MFPSFIISSPPDLGDGASGIPPSRPAAGWSDREQPGFVLQHLSLFRPARANCLSCRDSAAISARFYANFFPHSKAHLISPTRQREWPTETALPTTKQEFEGHQDVVNSGKPFHLLVLSTFLSRAGEKRASFPSVGRLNQRMIMGWNVLMSKLSARQCRSGDKRYPPELGQSKVSRVRLVKAWGRLRQADAAITPSKLPDAPARAWQPSSPGQRGNSPSSSA